jgi:hypothetical protein
MQAIQTVTVGSGGATSIEFASIPDTFTDLVVLCSLRGDKSDAVSSGLIKFNGSGSDFFNIGLLGGAGGVSTNNYPDSRQINAINGNTTTANTFSSHSVYITNYTSDSYKSFSADGATENNGGYSEVGILANLWSNTAAITSIELVNEGLVKFMQYSTATLYGIKSTAGSGAPKASGGMISYDEANNKWVHVFTASGTFTPTEDLDCEYLVVAGGGGGTGVAASSGGGGAGGLLTNIGGVPHELVGTVNYSIIVGAGGPVTSSQTTPAGGQGSNSTFSTVTSTGGGGGGVGRNSDNQYSAGGGGGSGGGGGITNVTATNAGGSGTSGQGNGGGTGNSINNNTNRHSGGGGGAGAVGGNGTSSKGGDGGAGLVVSITGTAIYYAGGGGGGGGAGAGLGGLGGGGNGAAGDMQSGTAGQVNTGGGGGQGFSFTTESTPFFRPGGSGVVIIRYPAL